MVYDWGIFSAASACFGDQQERATEDIERFRALVPESLFAQDAEVFCLSNAGKWTEASKLLASLPQPDLETPYRGKAAAAFFRAAASRAPADLEAGRRLALAKAKESPIALRSAIVWLAALGYIDDAFALAQAYNPDTAPDLFPNLFLFQPLARNLQRDPRFMELASRIGLVDYWQATGHWPDFCSEPGLPYDCKAEAERQAAKRPS